MIKKIFIFSLLSLFISSLTCFAQTTSINDYNSSKILVARNNNQRSSNVWENIKDSLQDNNRQNNYNNQRNREYYKERNYHNNRNNYYNNRDNYYRDRNRH